MLYIKDMININDITNQLKDYGLTETESQVYLLLVKHSDEVSVVEIARTLKLGRTPVYNATEKLESKGLISRVMSENGNRFKANSPDNLEQYWRQKIHNAEKLNSKLPDLVNILEGMTGAPGYESKIRYYTGRRGLEQITYNSLRAKEDLYIYEVATNMTIFINHDTAERFRQTLVDRKITTHQLTNHFIIDEFTEVTRMVNDFWDIRYIDPKILSIQFEMIIYNDVCALYSVDGGDAFGVEVYNANLASMQKQIFKAMQLLANPMEKVGNYGGTRLVKGQS